MKAQILIVCLLLMGCSQTKVEDIQLINGYWEIEKVTFPSGESKTYKVNSVIDYIELKKDSTGTRGKVMPQLDGTFVTMKEYETFYVQKKGKDLLLIYPGEEHARKEKIAKLAQNELAVSNDQGKTYFYKRFEKFELK